MANHSPNRIDTIYGKVGNDTLSVFNFIDAVKPNVFDKDKNFYGSLFDKQSAIYIEAIVSKNSNNGRVSEKNDIYIPLLTFVTIAKNIVNEKWNMFVKVTPAESSEPNGFIYSAGPTSDRKLVIYYNQATSLWTFTVEQEKRVHSVEVTTLDIKAKMEGILALYDGMKAYYYRDLLKAKKDCYDYVTAQKTENK